MGGTAVSLALKSGEIWVFRHDGAAGLSLQPSVYLERGRLKPRAAKQIVLSGRMQEIEAGSAGPWRKHRILRWQSVTLIRMICRHAPKPEGLPACHILLTINLVHVGRALISVSDKTGLIELARALGRTMGSNWCPPAARRNALRAAGLAVRDVAEVTGFPEMMDGRVKTLHPKVHGGLLALRDDDEHLLAMAAHGIEPIDLLIVNLYPFEATVARVPIL